MVYLINKLSSHLINFDAPYYNLHNKFPSYNDLHIFGCVCFAHLPIHKWHKLSVKSVKYAFLGYNVSHKGFVCYDMSYNKFCISQNVVFFDNHYFFPTQVEPSFVASILPNFKDLSSFEQFKLDIVYQKHRPTLPLPKAASRPEATFAPPYKHVLRRSI